jgi:hypothetical protein
VTRTLSWHKSSMESAHYLAKVKIWAKFEEDPAEYRIYSAETKLSDKNLQDWPRTSIAHWLEKVNIWVKFEGTPSKSIEFIEQKQNLTLTYKVDLESEGHNLSKARRKSFKRYRIYRADMILSDIWPSGLLLLWLPHNLENLYNMTLNKWLSVHMISMQLFTYLNKNKDENKNILISKHYWCTFVKVACLVNTNFCLVLSWLLVNLSGFLG